MDGKKVIEIKCKGADTLPIDRILEFQGELKTLSKGNEKKLRNSILKFGFIAPFFVWDDKGEWRLLDGHQRLKTLLKMREEGYDIPLLPVDYIEADSEEDAKRKLLHITSQYGEFSPEGFENFTFGLDGFEDIRLTNDEFDISFLRDKDEVKDDNYEIPDEIETDIKVGDIFQIGEHRLMCGDSTDKATIEKLMDGAKADMVLSDPPYGMFLDTDFSSCLGGLGSLGRKNHTRGNKYDKVIGDNEDFKPELITTFFDNFNYCKEIFLFGADYFAEILPNKNNGSWLVWDKRKESQADAIGAEFELIWSKQKHKRRMLRHDWFGFLSSQNAKDAQHRIHPTQKPITLLADIIKQWGQDCNIIIDLYGGSGSTLIACEQLGKTCYMMELDPKYCQVIIDRMRALDGTIEIRRNGELYD